MNLLIVDDEPIIRIGLRTLVDWKQHGFNLVGEASDGVEALEFLNDHAVDILITDIRMPNMDGLELIRRARLLSEDLGVLVLSCLDDFDYVKEAMKLGSSDYILKPTMEPDDLIAILHSMKKTMLETRETKEQISLWQYQLEQSRPFQMAARVHHYIENEISDDTLEEDLFSTENVLYSIMIYWSSAITMTMGEWEFNDCAASIKWKDNRMLLLYPGNAGLSGHEYFQITYKKANELEQLFLRKLEKHKDQWMICIGKEMNKLADLKPMMELHQRQIQHRFYGQTTDRLIWEDCFINKHNRELPYHHRNDLLRSISNHNADGILYHTEQMGNIFKEVKAPTTKLHGFVFEWLGLALAHARQSGYVRLDDYEHQYITLETIQQFIDIDSLNLWLLEAMQHLWSCRWGGESSSTNPFIRKALEFMRNNYQKKIGALDIADHVKLSRSYLSDLYSKEVGESLIETLTRIRMDMAKLKLNAGELKIYEVAESVGFTDGKSFAKTFKRLVGCTPKEYETQNK